MLGDDAAERLQRPMAIFDGQGAPELIQRDNGRRLGPARGGTSLVLGCRMMTLLAEPRADAHRTSGQDSRAPAARLWAARVRIDEVLLREGCVCLLWHHHMALVAVAHLFVTLTRVRLKKSNGPAKG